MEKLGDHLKSLQAESDKLEQEKDSYIIASANKMDLIQQLIQSGILFLLIIS